MVDHPSLPEYTPPLPVLEKWIERSCSLPLTFSIKQCGQGGDQYKGPYEPKPKRVLEMFIPHHLRWKRVFLFPGRSSTGLNLLKNSSSGPMAYPELRQIILRNKSWNYSEIEDDAASLVHLLKHAPCLVSININLASPSSRVMTGEDFRRCYVDPIQAAIPWDRLEELSFPTETFTPLRVLEILRRGCPKLRSVTFNVSKGSSDEDEDDDDDHNPYQFQQQHSSARGPEYPLAYHDRLETLRLIPVLVDEPTIILKRATLPKLRDLTLYVPYELHDNREAWKEKGMVDEFKNFIRRSRCALEELHYISISANSLYPPPVLECLSSVSMSLQVLSLQAYNADALMKVLTVRGQRSNGNQVFCPNLHSIKLISWRYGGHGLLADMVESRWNPSSEMRIAKLRSVNVGFTFNDFPFEDQFEPAPDPSLLTGDVQRLQALNRDGWGRKIGLTVYKNNVVTEYVK
ncbi:hypothetical protein H1R20_g15940, partial [Candolleomyces eurysporus]